VAGRDSAPTGTDLETNRDGAGTSAAPGRNPTYPASMTLDARRMVLEGMFESWRA